MLNSAEHEIFTAHKYQNCIHYLYFTLKPPKSLNLLMHVRNEASATVGIFNIYEQDEFRLSSGEHVLWLYNNLGPVLKPYKSFTLFASE